MENGHRENGIRKANRSKKLPRDREPHPKVYNMETRYISKAVAK